MKESQQLLFNYWQEYFSYFFSFNELIKMNILYTREREKKTELHSVE